MLLERFYRWRLGIMLSVVTGLAAILRFVNLGHPRDLVFDEYHYARQSYSMLHQGYPGRWVGEDQKDAFVNGDLSQLMESPDRTVHPPLGKWLIAPGMEMFGVNAFGWRFTAALFGTATVAIIALVAVKLFKSVLWGGIAGLFLAIDGQHIVHSRTALLDIFLTFFVVLAFAFLVFDRSFAKRRILSRAAAERTRLGLKRTEPLPGYGPASGLVWGPLRLRPWRLAAIISLGLACGVKWSAMFVAAFFLLGSAAWDLIDRRSIGVKNLTGGWLVRAAIPAFVATLVFLPLTYTATWASWFASDHGYHRHWAERHPDEGVQWLPEMWRSWVYYHQDSYDFHVNLTNEDFDHPYESHPEQWLLQLRPTAYHFNTVEGTEAQELCGAEKCHAAQHGIGHPLLWWLATPALFAAIWAAIRKRDQLAGTLAVGVLAGWLPWFMYPDRIIFQFYSVVFAPWMMLVLAWALKQFAQPPRLNGAWTRTGGIVLAAFVAASLVLTGYFFPIWSGQWIPREYWQAHMWIPNFELFGAKFGWI